MTPQSFFAPKISWAPHSTLLDTKIFPSFWDVQTLLRIFYCSNISTDHCIIPSLYLRCTYDQANNTSLQFKQINQLDATISQVYYLMFMYSLTCFGRPRAHHQELNNCSSSLWFYRWSVVVAVLLVVVRADPPDHDQQHCYHHTPTVKPDAATTVVELLMMGARTPETCWAVHKHQVINVRNCCI